ncbi:MAG: thermonuclease family protein, partial [Thermanaerothrix sp.]|nr:thermonuclease family protein [Thermanaerothrix sp.]
AKVTRVIDGDTIEVEINGARFKVRYIGIDTPESTTQIEYFGKEAAARNQALVGGREVTLIKDVSETDRYGRLLRYVLVDKMFVNYELVRGGYANALRYPPDVACADVFQAAERQAREEGLGLWAPTSTPTPTP